jgi:hypothetical protein
MNGKGGKYISLLIEDGATQDEFGIELLMISTPEFCREIESILCRTSIFPVGLNGNYGMNIIHSDLTREKIRKFRTGKKHSEESIELMRLKHKGKVISPHTNIHKEKISESMMGKNTGPHPWVTPNHKTLVFDVQEQVRKMVTSDEYGSDRERYISCRITRI